MARQQHRAPPAPSSSRGSVFYEEDEENEEEERLYDEYLTRLHQHMDISESRGYLVASLFICLVSAWRGWLMLYPRAYLLWMTTVAPCGAIPGIVALLFPAFYARRRELVVVNSKLLLAVIWAPFRLAWHAPGTPASVADRFGSGPFKLKLPIHPVTLVQSGAIVGFVTSFRHSLRFRAQLLCQLVFLVAMLQAETAVRQHRPAAQHFSNPTAATVVQIVCGTLLPLIQHWLLDRQRRHKWRQAVLEERRRQQRQRQQVDPSGRLRQALQSG